MAGELAQGQAGTGLPPISDTAGTKPKPAKSKPRTRDKDSVAAKRRCVSTACIACRRRKSKCDGTTPSCAACASVYGTDCVYDPNSDHRRKGVYKKDIDNLKTRNSTLQTLVQAILNYPEHEVLDLVKQIRTCESLDDVAEGILARDLLMEAEGDDLDSPQHDCNSPALPTFETELSGKMRELRLENGSVRFIGGTSNLLFLDADSSMEATITPKEEVLYQRQEDAIASWTTVVANPELITHLLNMYFTWHYTYFTTLSRSLFFRDFLRGRPAEDTQRKNEHCTSMLVNAMLALGCHFTSWPAARSDPNDPATVGDHFFKEAKRVMLVNDEHENPRLPTVQALALMSVREAGCGREAKGWVYSGMSFRMACDLGLNVDSANNNLEEEEIDARRITFWGCFLFDKCWSNYLGRPPQLPPSNITVPKFDVFPDEDADLWSPWTDSGLGQLHIQPSRTRAVALQISLLCEISSDLLFNFYHPSHIDKALGKQAEQKKLSELHTRLEAWRKNLPKEMEPREGQLPNVLVMHMFFQLLYIHLFRPFLKTNQPNSPLPTHVSPRKLCTTAAATISKLLRIYKRTYGVRQICNIAVYIAHSACTIHLLNLPENDARRDIIHGVRQLEEIAENWPCARRTLSILSVQVRRWHVELPEEAATVLARIDTKFGVLRGHDESASRSPTKSPRSIHPSSPGILTDRVSTATAPSNGHLDRSRTENAVPHVHHAQVFSSGPQAGFSSQTPSHIYPAPHQHRHAIPHIQPQLWNEEVRQNLLHQSHTSPTVLFGGMDTMFEDSRDWWLKDQSMLFDNWTQAGAEGTMLANGFEDGGSDLANGSEGNMIQNLNVENRMGYPGTSNGGDAGAFGFGTGRMY